MSGPKQANALSNYYYEKYKERYGVAPTFNRNKARWSWDNVLLDMSPVEAQSLIDYYFTTVSVNAHSLDWFFYNYDKLSESKIRGDEEEARLKVIREATRKRTEEWKEKHGRD